MSETGPDFSFQVIGRKDVGQHVPDSVERASSVQQTQDVDLNESTARSGSRLLGSSQDDSPSRRLRMPAALAVAIGFIAVVLAVRALPGRPELTLELPRLADQSVQEGETLVVSARVGSSQPVSLPLAYRLGPDMPDGVRIDPTHGEITWAPSEKQGPGTYILTVVLESAGQQEKEYDRASFKVKVSEANRPPKIADLSPQTIDVHQAETFDRVIAASDPDDPPNKLTFSLVSSTVDGAEIDAKTGRFTWTPS
ncbi:MAG: putative Ig domain-containing protein, partial [Pirellulaceae bacterium]